MRGGSSRTRRSKRCSAETSGVEKRGPESTCSRPGFTLGFGDAAAQLTHRSLYNQPSPLNACLCLCVCGTMRCNHKLELVQYVAGVLHLDRCDLRTTERESCPKLNA
eukprot:2432693-Prymnesium_polylepis.1